ncbi:sulfotransferase family 2 domain-containing protein [Loktanella sp. S4079]|uniref:sulfotransferase family 2 domain-containing protein n=1 Tax=Loktanella sp. S4079 TaxID=579483 RepID=UPI0005F9D12A|nr:sulfotransferase family 2 domain-containing protein [Loktanella sp. S4079]KJZ19358.1 nodulation protein NodH [Loktanella sp. S4079]
MSKFDYFVILAEMRTGSNFLEANLNAVDGLTCHGEAFNPAFIGYPKNDTLLGMTYAQRETDPEALIEKIRASDGLNGFRLFHDHDHRALDIVLADPRCAKVILNRNPLDSYVSWKAARATGQWKLTNATHSKFTEVQFDQAEFETQLEILQKFQRDVQHRLQTTGQTGFYIGYDDLRDVDVMNGLLRFIGADARIDSLDKKLKKQNPEPLEKRVQNFSEMREALRDLDRFDLSRTPNFEPRRGPAIPTYIAADGAGLLYMPLRSGPDWSVKRFLGDLEGVRPRALQRKFTQKTLRQWQASRVGHRSFTVLRHPVARAHAAFCDCILSDGAGSFPGIRANLIKVHKLRIPDGIADISDRTGYDDTQHYKAFLSFLQFLKNNLSGQTSIRVDPAWASQLTLLQGMAEFGFPDVIMREERLEVELHALARQRGVLDPPAIQPTAHAHHDRLIAIYDAEIEKAAHEAYARDYEAFGFGAWA